MTSCSDVRIHRRLVGVGHPVYCIAEVGSNHNGSFEEAEYLVRAMASAGADAVKFQAYCREDLFNPTLPRPSNDAETKNAVLLKRRWEVLPRFTVEDDWWPRLAALCEEVGVDFLCTPFSLEALEGLVPLMPAIKIASGDITWLELLEASGRCGRPVIFSTGASDLQEAERAADTIRSSGCEDVVVLHCVSNYPPRWDQTNLRSMVHLGQTLGANFGLSDHTPGATLPLAARAMGACVIEKHVTRDRTQEGLDHHFAMTPAEFGQMVRDLRNLEAGMGSAEKQWTTEEAIERFWVRRGIWVKQNLAAGTVVERSHLSVVRPCYGVPADKLNEVVGKSLKRAKGRFEPINPEDLE